MALADGRKGAWDCSRSPLNVRFLKMVNSRSACRVLPAGFAAASECTHHTTNQVRYAVVWKGIIPLRRARENLIGGHGIPLLA